MQTKSWRRRSACPPGNPRRRRTAPCSVDRPIRAALAGSRRLGSWIWLACTAHPARAPRDPARGSTAPRRQSRSRSRMPACQHKAVICRSCKVCGTVRPAARKSRAFRAFHTVQRRPFARQRLRRLDRLAWRGAYRQNNLGPQRAPPSAATGQRSADVCHRRCVCLAAAAVETSRPDRSLRRTQPCGSFMAKWRLPSGGKGLKRELLWETRVRMPKQIWYWTPPTTHLRGPNEQRRPPVARHGVHSPRRDRTITESSTNSNDSEWVAEVGVEPTHCCQYWILSPARLPIPPLGQAGGRLY
jgi:hypothetical protein